MQAGDRQNMGNAGRSKGLDDPFGQVRAVRQDQGSQKSAGIRGLLGREESRHPLSNDLNGSLEPVAGRRTEPHDAAFVFDGSPDVDTSQVGAALPVELAWIPQVSHPLKFCLGQHDVAHSKLLKRPFDVELRSSAHRSASPAPSKPCCFHKQPRAGIRSLRLVGQNGLQQDWIPRSLLCQVVFR